MQKKEVFIPIYNLQIQADVYLQQPSMPFIVMAHGLGGEKSCGLQYYVQFYLKLGYNVCCFDHRGFGQSTGKYKNLVDKHSQLQDWQSVIDYLKKQYQISEKALILWGYSFSGGHVLTLGSQKNYKAIIANFPHVDGFASLLGYPKRYLVPATCLAMTDFCASLVGKSKSMPVVAQDRFAVLSGKDCYDGYYSLLDSDQQWDNQVPARIVLTIPFYRPIALSHRIRTPTLLIGAKQDSLIPIKRTRKTAQQSRAIRYLEHDCGHFDLFHSPYMEHIQSQHQEFLADL